MMQVMKTFDVGFKATFGMFESMYGLAYRFIFRWTWAFLAFVVLVGFVYAVAAYPFVPYMLAVLIVPIYILVLYGTVYNNGRRMLAEGYSAK